MSKPQWDTLPGWVEYIAQNADGTWWGYGNEPYPHDGHSWLNSHWQGRQCPHPDKPNPNWRDTLEKRPSKTENQE